MAGAQKHSIQVTIKNRMGFHVRPVQRFAQLARLFKADVEVEMRDRTVPGKSVMNLVSLGGRCGDTMRIAARGVDAQQCVGVLGFLAENTFFVEDDLDVEQYPDRHVERLAHLASCFRSDVEVILDGRKADAKKLGAVASLGLTPTSTPEFEIRGEDAEQAQGVLDNLVASCFYVEDKMAERGQKVT